MHNKIQIYKNITIKFWLNGKFRILLTQLVWVQNSSFTYFNSFLKIKRLNDPQIIQFILNANKH